MNFLKEALSEKVLGAPIWVLVALLALVLIVLPNLGTIMNRLRRSQLPQQVMIGAVLFVALSATILILSDRLDGLALARAIVVSVFVLLVVTATISIYRHRIRLYTPDPGKEAAPATGINAPWRRLFAGNPTQGAIHVSQLGLWALIALWLLPAVIFLVLPFSWPLWMRAVAGVGALAFVMAYTAAGIVVVPGNPPHRAVYMFLGARTETEFDEGTSFVLLGIESLVTVNITKRDLNVEIEDIRTKDNAHLRVRIQVPWIPDRDRLYEFLGSGGEPGVRALMDDYVRERARDFFIEKIEAREVTRRVFRYAGTEQDLKPELVPEPQLLEPWEAALGYREDVRGHLIYTLVDDFHLMTETRRVVVGEKETDEERIMGAEMRKQLRKGGREDQFHWGIRILDVNISTILPSGKTAEAADRRSQETGERAAEIFEIESEYLQAAKLIELLRRLGVGAEKMSFETAYRLLLDYKMVRGDHGFTIPGLPDAVQKAVQAFLEKTKRGGT
ncbi:MAG: hypothetical protein HY340_00675 [Candidatus Kerfeldbacteria bacterium]|nr:hypothetical protein [Candidatus Kerfeldbacteria bacterium]